MVMEAPPSPQCVGREFVRQYYTLLNKAPTHLHRFYNNHSSFVHGGLDPPNRETSPMIGQKQIHQKIQQLNFQDCHAKITQVDSQATLGNGVVVQVTGELSNAGQPMRRFTQTFVLAAQSPKKYYVHNDIFRYQDEVFTDEECDPESGRSEPEEDLAQTTIQEPTQQQPPMPQQQPPMAYYAPTGGAPTGIQPAPGMTVPPPQQQHHVPPPAAVMNAAGTVAPTVATVNGAVHPEDVMPPQQQQQQPVNAMMSAHNAHMAMAQQQHQVAVAALATVPNQQPAAVPSHQQAQQQVQPEEESLKGNNETQQPHEPETVAVIEEPYVEEKPEVIEPPQEEVQMMTQEPPVVSSEPKTYATLVKSGGNSGSVSFASAAMATSPNQISKPSNSPPPAMRTDSREQSSLSGPPLGQPPLGQRNMSNRGARTNNTGGRNATRQDSLRLNRPGFNEDNEERRRSSAGPMNNNSSPYGDANQLFLGNLPHSATEDELRDLFSQFGAVVELRIHSKSGSKGVPGGRVPPNYGFITYEDQQSVQNCLANRPLYFPPNSDNGQKLNVEEKKTRPRQSMDGGRINSVGGPDNNLGGRPGSGVGPRSGGGSGGGMMRGGPIGGGGGHRGPGQRGGGNFQRGGGDNRGGGGGQNMNRGGNNSYVNRR